MLLNGSGIECSVQNYHHTNSQIIDHNIWQKSHEITTLWSSLKGWQNPGHP